MAADVSPTRATRRYDVLGALRRAPGPLAIADLAAEIGIHPNTVRFHLDGLIGSGRVREVPPVPSGPGRPAARFQPVPGMDPGGPRQFRVLAEILVAALAAMPRPSRRATEAGRAWGRGLPPPARRESPVRHLLSLLTELGFAPDPPAGRGEDRTIGLRNCPFLELAEADPSVICPIHLGLMQGVLETAGAPLTVHRLDPFVEPDRCVAHLGSRAVAS